MQKDIFEKVLNRKVSQITFSGHRVNDDYSMNKRKVIVAAVMSAFDEAAEQCLHADAGESAPSQAVSNASASVFPVTT